MSDCNEAVPKLNIAILVVGTRGDVQPFLEVARRLQEYGHCVRLATHSLFDEMVKSAGIDFYPLGGDPRIFIKGAVQNKRPGREMIAQFEAVIDTLLPACTRPGPITGKPFRAQAIIANPPTRGCKDLAEALAIPLHICYIIPWTKISSDSHSPLLENHWRKCTGHYERRLTKSGKKLQCSLCLRHCGKCYQFESSMSRPTYAFPHILSPQMTPKAGYLLSYRFFELVMWWTVRSYLNNWRKNELNLGPNIGLFDTSRISISNLPTTYLWSPHVLPKPNDWSPLIDIVGYSFVDLGSKYEPPQELVQWIKNGPKPIYIGFGSMPLEDSENTLNIILKALKNTGQRGIIDQGWGGLATNADVTEDVFLVSDCPHDWLFPQCYALVHHGGAGTTACGLKAGCPSTIVPFFGDLFMWGAIIHAKGVGPVPIPISQLTAESLSEAIRFMLQPQVKTRAMELAVCIEGEDGAGAAVVSFHRHLRSKLALAPVLPLEEKEKEEEKGSVDFVKRFFGYIGYG